MKKRFLAFGIMVAGLLFLQSCDTGTSDSNTGNEPSNQFVGAWEAEHVYTSGYTDPVVFPVAMDTVTYDLYIKNDGSYYEEYKAVYVDNSLSSGSYSGTYAFDGNSITLTPVSGTYKNEPIDAEYLPDPSIFELTGSILLEMNSTSAECPTKDSDGRLMYPIVLSFTKK